MPQKLDMSKDTVRKKNICSSCVGDTFITEWIEENGVVEKCDYCEIEVTAKCVKIEKLCDWVDEVYRENYRPGDEYSVVIEGQDKTDWGVMGSDPREIIGEMLCTEEAVVNDVVEVLSDWGNYDVSRGGETYYDTTSCYERIPVHDSHYSDLWNNFCNTVKHQSRFFSTSAIELLNELFAGTLKLQLTDNQALIRDINLENDERFIYRARNARGKNTRIEICLYPHRGLGAPPKHSAVAGRMNPAGIPVFYGAFDRETCLSELRLPVGDIAVSGKFEIIKPLKVMDLSILHGIYKELSLFHPSFKNKTGHLEFLQRFDGEVSRPVLPGDELLEYIPTQALVEYLANHHESNIDGLIYSSAQTGGAGKNIVVFNNASHIEPIDHAENTNGPRRFEEMWIPSDSIYSLFETDDENKGDLIESAISNDEVVADPSLRFVVDSLKIHRITSVKHECGSDSISIRYKEDLENYDSDPLIISGL